MGNDSGCATVAWAAVSVVCVIGFIVLGISWIGGQLGEAVQDARTSIAASQAREAQARADVARERTDAARETNLHRETMFYAWTVALAGFSANNQGVLVFIAVGMGMAVAALVIRWLESGLFSGRGDRPR